MILMKAEFDHNQLFWSTSRYNQREPDPLFAIFSSKKIKERKKIT